MSFFNAQCLDKISVQLLGINKKKVSELYSLILLINNRHTFGINTRKENSIHDLILHSLLFTINGISKNRPIEVKLNDQKTHIPLGQILVLLILTETST